MDIDSFDNSSSIFWPYILTTPSCQPAAGSIDNSMLLVFIGIKTQSGMVRSQDKPVIYGTEIFESKQKQAFWLGNFACYTVINYEINCVIEREQLNEPNSHRQ